MFYHVIIERKDEKKGAQLSELDKEHERDIIDEVILPFVKKQDFQFNGYFLKSSEISRIIIIESDISSKQLSANAQGRLSSNIIMYISPLMAVQDDDYTRDITKELFKKANNVKEAQETLNKQDEENTKKALNRGQVFIVHGHDALAKTECESFVRQIGYEPIILHKEASQGKTIIEKIEHYSNVGFGIVLYTPCDVGAQVAEKRNLQPRARQNVVLEHGFIMGNIGRKNVVALVKGNIEKPNDISGVVYEDMDEKGAWRFKVAQEMKAAGYDVDMNKIK
jgi:predicted nucleotide-binding protein